jgi:hypothetical protein
MGTFGKLGLMAMAASASATAEPYSSHRKCAIDRFANTLGSSGTNCRHLQGHACVADTCAADARATGAGATDAYAAGTGATKSDAISACAASACEAGAYATKEGPTWDMVC